MTPVSTAQKAPALIVLAAAMLLASLGISITAVALPALSQAFSIPGAIVQWIVLAYLVSVTVVIVLAGRFGDIFGRRKVLITGFAIFTVASLVCGIAPTFEILVGARAVQGVGGAVLMALPVGMARDMVVKERVGSAMGLLGTMSACGTALGPALGGVLIAGFGWRAAFFLLAGAGAAALAFSLRAVPAAPPQVGSLQRRVDWPGAALLSIALAAYALAMTGGLAGGWSGGLLLAVAASACALFIAVEARSPSPIVAVPVLRHRTVGAALAANLLVSVVMMSTLVIGPFFLSFGLSLSDTRVGFVMAVGPVIAAFSGFPAGRITDRFGASRVGAIGLLEIAVGLLCLAFLPRWFGAAGYVAALVVLTPGFQLFLAANNTAVMLAAEEKQRGMLSGLLGLSRNLGFVTGASALGALFAFRVGMTEVHEAAGSAVADAFTATFLAAFGLAVLALLIHLVSGRNERTDSAG